MVGRPAGSSRKGRIVLIALAALIAAGGTGATQLDQDTPGFGLVAEDAIMWFDAATCPDGWSEVEQLRGRYAVGLVSNGTLNGTVGTSLADQENRPVGHHDHVVDDRGHEHPYERAVDAAYASTLSEDTTLYRTTSDPVPMGVSTTGVEIEPAGETPGTNAPYIQLAACKPSTSLASIEPGAVAFLDRPSCPVGWEPFTQARGRAIVGLPPEGSAGATVGVALEDLENRPVGRHTHAVNDPGHTALYRPPTKVAGTAGSIQSGSPHDASTGLSKTGIELVPTGLRAGTNAPYLQLLACSAGPNASLAPPGLTTFVDAPACPTGWIPSEQARGRYLVGTPENGLVGATVGSALTDLEERPVGRHTHPVDDPGHRHTYQAVGSGPTWPFVDGPYAQPVGTDTVRAFTGLTVEPTGSVPGTNAPYVQLPACTFLGL